METVLLVLICAGSALVLGTTGFGLALVGMPLLSWLLGVKVAAPLVALLGLSLHPIILFRYRISFNSGAVGRLALGAVAGIPLGVWAIGAIPEAIFLKALGLLLIGYAAYALLSPRLPALSAHPGWAYGFGFAGGCLGGAYNVPGPVVILYGHLRRWQRDEFKSNLQGFFLLTIIVITIVHGLSGNLSWTVWRSWLWATPASWLGMLAGLALDRWIHPPLFQKLVLFLLLGLGGSLLL